MKIVYISLTENKNPGAREIQVSRLLESFNKTEHMMYLVTVENKFVNTNYVYKVSSIKETSKFGRFIKNIFPNTSRIRKVALEINELLHCLKPDIVITSSNPLESHLLGLYIKLKWGFKWVAFFSDPKPISLLPYPYASNKRMLVRWGQYRIVKRVFKLSDLILMPSKYGIQISSQIYNLDLENKARTIPHFGFSNSGVPVPQNGYIVHAGKLVSKRSSVELLNALKRIKEENYIGIKGLLCLGIVSEGFKKQAKELGMEDFIIDKGMVDLETSRNYLKGAKCILIIEADMTISPFLPSKFAEAVSLNRPIIAITPKVSAIRDYLNSINGLAVNNQQDEIYEAFLKINHEIKMEKSRCFDESIVVKEYLNIIHEILNK